jgi:hypothetical protein
MSASVRKRSGVERKEKWKRKRKALFKDFVE